MLMKSSPLRWLLLFAAFSIAARSVPEKIIPARDAVPLSLSAYKLVEYYNSKGIDYRSVLKQEPVTVCGLVSNIQVNKDGASILLFENKVTVLLKDGGDTPKMKELSNYYENQKKKVCYKTKAYQNFYIKLIAKGKCVNPRKVRSKVDLAEAEIIAWQGISISRSEDESGEEIIQFKPEGKLSAPKLVYYKSIEPGQEAQDLSGEYLRLNYSSRVLSLGIKIKGKQIKIIPGSDPLSYVTEIDEIIKHLRKNAFGDVLSLDLSALPRDKFGRLYSDASIVSWKFRNPNVKLFKPVNEFRKTVILKQLEPAEAPPKKEKNSRKGRSKKTLPSRLRYTSLIKAF